MSVFYKRFYVIALLSALSFLSLGAKANSESNCNQDLTLDPYQSLNRKIFTFNDTLDAWILKPVAKGYRLVTPNPVETGISNVFSNLGEVKNIVNDVFQWKWNRAAKDTGRLLLNSTVGIAGIFDVAKHAGIEKSLGEDFGQTLAQWGVCSGNYIVLPFLGPSTIRDGIAMPVDIALDPVRYIDEDGVRIGVSVLDLVQVRASLLDLEELASGDRYSFLRDAYRQRRQYLENDGNVVFDAEDEFGDFQ